MLIAALPLQEEHGGQHEDLHVRFAVRLGDHGQVAFHQRHRVAGVQFGLSQLAQESQQNAPVHGVRGFLLGHGTKVTVGVPAWAFVAT